MTSHWLKPAGNSGVALSAKNDRHDLRVRHDRASARLYLGERRARLCTSSIARAPWHA